MSVAEIVCAKCEKRYKMKPEYAGRTLKCACGSKIVAPTMDEPEEEGIYDVVEPAAPAYAAPVMSVAQPHSQAAPVGMATARPLQYATPNRYGYDIVYAGFWWRFLAAFIDGVLLIFPTMIVQFAIQSVPATGDMQVVLAIISMLSGYVIAWLYDAFMTASVHRGTLGKKWLGIQVSDLNGDQLTFGRATGRHFAKFLSSLTLLIGYIWAAFHPQKRALHDLIAGTVVTKN